jgi:hypothetical protein
MAAPTVVCSWANGGRLIVDVWFPCSLGLGTEEVGPRRCGSLGVRGRCPPRAGSPRPSTGRSSLRAGAVGRGPADTPSCCSPLPGVGGGRGVERGVRGRPRRLGREALAWRRAMRSRRRVRIVSGRASLQAPRCWSRERIEQRGRQSPIGRLEPDLLRAELALQHGDLMTQRENLGVPVPITARQQPQQCANAFVTPRYASRSNTKRHHRAVNRPTGPLRPQPS